MNWCTRRDWRRIDLNHSVVFDPANSSDGRPPLESDSISLAELTAGHVDVEWHEALACAQAICASIPEKTPSRLQAFAAFGWESDPVSPDSMTSHFRNISLGPDGDVVVDAFDMLTEEESVRVMASLLSVLPVRNGSPGALHSILDRAGAVPPVFKTIRELSGALAYFERPNRQQLVRGLYQRARAASRPVLEARRVEPVTPAAAGQAPPVAIPQSVPATPVPPKVAEITDGIETLRRKLIGVSTTATSAVDRVARKSGATWRPFMTGAALSAALAAAILLYSSIRETPARTARPPIAVEPPAVHSSAVTASTAAPGQATSVAPAARSSQRATRATLHRPPRPLPHSPVPARTVSNPISVAMAVRPSITEWQPVPAAIVTRAPEPAVANEPTTKPGAGQVTPDNTVRGSVVADLVYSTADPDVVPPVRVYPVRSEGHDTPQDGGAAIQIVIDKNGRVASAVLVRRPASMGDAILATMRLAAAKSWRFRPAVKNGSPVSYRHTVWFAPQ